MSGCEVLLWIFRVFPVFFPSISRVRETDSEGMDEDIERNDPKVDPSRRKLFQNDPELRWIGL